MLVDENQPLLRGSSDLRPHKHTRRAGLVPSIANLLNTILGTGLLATPSILASCGVIPGALSLLFSALTAAFGLYLLSLCAAQVTKESGPDSKASFSAIAEITYPSAQKVVEIAIAAKCFGQFLSAVFQYDLHTDGFGLVVGVACGYLIILGQICPRVVLTLFHLLSQSEAPWWAVNRQLWTLVIAVPLIPLAFLKSLNSLRHTSYISLFSVIYLVFIVTIYFLIPINPNQPDPSPSLPPVWEWAKWHTTVFSKFPISIFAYTCAQNIFPIFNELRNPTQNRVNSIIGTSIGVALSLYELVAILGYLTFGTAVGGNIMAMYPETSLLVAGGRVAIIVLILFSYPLQVHPCRTSLLNLFPSNGQDSSPENARSSVASFSQRPPPSNRLFNGLTVCILILSFSVALLVKDLDKVLSIVGATGSTTISFILPGIFYWKISDPRNARDDDELADGDEHSPKLRQAAGALAGWGVFVMAFCLSFNILHIFRPPT